MNNKDKIILSRDLYAQAAAEGITLSQLLEREYPSADGGDLTAFQRAMKQQGIIAKSRLERGYSAHSVEAFYQTAENKVLFPEYVATNMREELMMASILPYLVSTVTMIDSNSFKSAAILFEDQNKRTIRLRRVTEGSELSKAKVTLKEKAINIYKYGIALEATYEAIRRMKIDVFTRHTRFIALQQSLDEADNILDIMVSGDGNKNTEAKRYLASDLDSKATNGNLTTEAWISFLMEFFPYGARTVVGGKSAILKLFSMLTPDNGAQILGSLSANRSVTLDVDAPQGLFQKVNALYFPDTPVVEYKGKKYNALFALNPDYAFEKIVEAGSDISEADRFITRQTEVLTISENSGFSSMYPQATGILLLDEVA